MEEKEVNKVSEANEENKSGEGREKRHHHHHHHHRSHHSYLMEIDGERESSSRSSSSKKSKERKVLKKIDLSEKPFAVWIVIATFIIALLFLILMPAEVLLTNSHSISKWTAVSVSFSFTSIGSVLYLMRDKLTSRKTSGKVKSAIKGATLLVVSSGLILLFNFAVSNVSVITNNSFDDESGYITKAELKILLDEYNMSSNTQNGGVESDRIQLKVPERVNIAPEALNLALSDTSGRSMDDIFQSFKKSGTRLDVGYPVAIEFAVDQIMADKISYITVEVSENENFDDSRLFTLEADQRSCDVYHLKVGTKYYYRVSLFLSEEDNMVVRNRMGSFTVEETPRILSIDGIRNVRDVGGWLKTEDGKTVKQGLLYRGTELDGMVKEEYNLTAVGKADMLDVLKIKSDFDLRAHNDSNPLGVNKKSFAIPAYEGIFKDAGKDNVRILFSELAKNTNYPVYMHCTYGCDRTGVMMYLLELILGVDDDSAIKEYEFSSMSISGIIRENLFPVITGLEEYEGRSIQEKAENYLLSCGVKPEEIEAIRAIFLQ